MLSESEPWNEEPREKPHRIKSSLDPGNYDYAPSDEEETFENELRLVNTILFESFPYQTLSGIFLILGTSLLNKCKINELAKIAVVLVVNNMCYAVSNYLFTVAKHRLRLRLCKKLGIDPTERNIAVMESLEYQSV
jgi:hypothetical protein